MDANFADTLRDASEANRDQLGDGILKDAIRDGYYATAVNKEIATRLRLSELEELLGKIDLYDIPEDASAVYTIWRYSLAEAIADDNAHKVGSIFLEIFEPKILELKSKIENEFEKNPWQIERVLND
jgi:hypothetical protein